MARLLPSFIDRIKADDVQSDGIPIDYEILIDSSIVNWEFRRINKIYFKEVVVISNVDIKSGLVFIDCNFAKGIKFENVKSTNYNSDYNSSNSSVLFSKCNATFISFSNNCYFERSVILENECSVDEFYFKQSQIINSGIKIDSSSVNKLLDISNVKSNLKLNNTILNKNLKIETLEGDISFIFSTFRNWVQLWNVATPFSITLNNNVFDDTFKIAASKIKGLFIHGDTFNKEFELENRDLSGNNHHAFCKEIYITEAKFIEGANFNGLGQGLDKLTLHITPEFRGVLNFDNWFINETIISGVNQNLKLLFKSISFRFLFINDFTNYSDISFDRCKGYNDSTLNLVNSDLGSTRFNEFDFKSFNGLRFNNVSVDSVRPSNIRWFDDEKLEIEIADQTDEDKFKRKREIYRQFKQALKSNGNQIDSLMFQAREFESHRNELKNSKKYTLGERSIMLVSQINDYGLNWTKPAWIVILVTFLVYLLVLPSVSDEIQFSIAKNSSDIGFTWNAFTSNFKVLWQLFNPVRQMKLTYGENVDSGWVYFLDLLHRIFLGIMIFQIIKAFRKYVSN